MSASPIAIERGPAHARIPNLIKAMAPALQRRLDRMLDAGSSQRAVSSATGLSVGTIQRYIRYRNAVRGEQPRPEPSPQPQTRPLGAIAVALKRAGKTRTEIAAELGVSLGKVSGHLARALKAERAVRSDGLPYGSRRPPPQPKALKVTAHANFHFAHHGRSGPKAIEPTEREAIDAFLARREPRRFEPGATGNPQILIDWLNRECGRTAFVSAKKARGKMYVVDGRRCDLEGFIAVVDEERAKRRLKPLRAA